MGKRGNFGKVYTAASDSIVCGVGIEFEREVKKKIGSLTETNVCRYYTLRIFFYCVPLPFFSTDEARRRGDGRARFPPCCSRGVHFIFIFFFKLPPLAQHPSEGRRKKIYKINRNAHT